MNPDLSPRMPEIPAHQEALVELVDYDSSWPLQFEAEASALRSLLKPWLAGPIEHIGSTAVVGMPAKPVIDMMAAVQSLAASQTAGQELSRIGYQYAPYRSDVMHWFCKPGFAFRTHHLHLVPYDSALWRERLAFRDVLRASPRIAAEYATLKRQLAARYHLDREAYTEAKSPFVLQVLEGTSR